MHRILLTSTDLHILAWQLKRLEKPFLDVTNGNVRTWGEVYDFFREKGDNNNNNNDNTTNPKKPVLALRRLKKHQDEKFPL